MYPEFTIDDIEYTAVRFYTVVNRVPVSVIRCSVTHPEDFEPDVPSKRKRFMKLLIAGWPLGISLLVLVPLLTAWKGVFSTWEGWALLIGFVAVIIVSMYCMNLLLFNEKH